jgi:hypothetical protein
MVDKNILTVNEDLENRYNFAMCGKLTPYGKQKGSKGNREGLKLMGVFKPKSYPKHLKTDDQKFIFLKDLLGRDEVNTEIFIDLASVLSIKKEKIEQVAQEKEVSIINLFGGE